MRGRIGLMAMLAAAAAMAGSSVAPGQPGADIKGFPSAPVRLRKRRNSRQRVDGGGPPEPKLRRPSPRFFKKRAGVKGERTSRGNLLTHLRWQAERTGGKHATRAWICAEHGVPNTGRQWTRLRKRLAHEERTARERARRAA